MCRIVRSINSHKCMTILLEDLLLVTSLYHKYKGIDSQSRAFRCRICTTFECQDLSSFPQMFYPLNNRFTIIWVQADLLGLNQFLYTHLRRLIETATILTYLNPTYILECNEILTFCSPCSA